MGQFRKPKYGKTRKGRKDVVLIAEFLIRANGGVGGEREKGMEWMVEGRSRGDPFCLTKGGGVGREEKEGEGGPDGCD